MSHKTLIDGTSYNIIGGTSMIDGTTYNIVGGKTLIDGTGYNIPFNLEPSTSIATFYNDGSLIFSDPNYQDGTKTIIKQYRRYLNMYIDDYDEVPWYQQNPNIKTVSCQHLISPTYMQNWFYRCTNLTTVNYTNFDFNRYLPLIKEKQISGLKMQKKNKF